MSNFFTKRFMETYAPDGIDIYVDEIHDPQVQKASKERITDWREMSLLFLSLSSFRHQSHHKSNNQHTTPATNKQILTDTMINLSGYEHEGPRWWYGINTLLTIPTTLNNLFWLRYRILMNSIKFVTEFLPRSITVILLQYAHGIEHRSTFQYMLSLVLRVVAFPFMAIRFISRALTDPKANYRSAWRIGNALGGTSLGTDEEGNCIIIYKQEGKILGALFAGLNIAIFASACIIALPLILFYYEIFLPNWVVDYMPAFTLKMMELVNPVLDVMIYCFGLDNVINMLHLDKEIVTTQFCFSALLHPVAEELFSPHMRHFVKHSLMLGMDKVSSLTTYSLQKIVDANVAIASSLLLIQEKINFLPNPKPAQYVKAQKIDKKKMTESLVTDASKCTSTLFSAAKLKRIEARQRYDLRENNLPRCSISVETP